MRLEASSFWRCALAELGEAVGPAVGHAMRGAGVDHAGVGVTERGHQLLGRRVGQAEHGDVGRLGDLGALGEVLAVGHRQLEQLDVRPVLQPVVDLQAGGAVLAVDEDLGLVAGHGLLSRKFRAFRERADWRRRKDDGKPLDPLQRLHETARFLGARVFTPLVEAAASRPEGANVFMAARIFHPAGTMSRVRPAYIEPFSLPNSDLANHGAAQVFGARPFVVKGASRIAQFRAGESPWSCPASM